MYCTRCGVEIEAGLTRCPLCGNESLSADPGFETTLTEYTPLPERVEEARIGRVYRRLLSLIFGTAGAVVLITDILDQTGGIAWSPIALVAITAGYLFAFLPSLNLGVRTVFAFDLVVAGGLLLAVDRLEDGVVDWFVQIALPILGTLALLLFVAAWAIGKVRGVAKPAVVLIATAILCITIDLVVRTDLGMSVTLGWSLVVLASAVPAAAFLFLLQHSVLREIDLRRRFHL